MTTICESINSMSFLNTVASFPKEMPRDQSLQETCSQFANIALQEVGKGWKAVEDSFLKQWQTGSRNGKTLDNFVSTDYLKKAYDARCTSTNTATPEIPLGDINSKAQSLLSRAFSVLDTGSKMLLRKEVLIPAAIIMISAVAYKMLSKPALKPTSEVIPTIPVSISDDNTAKAPSKKSFNLSSFLSLKTRV